MNYHVLVTVYQGCPEGVKVFEDREVADRAEVEAKQELGIEEGAEAESENAVELFYNVPIIARERG